MSAVELDKLNFVHVDNVLRTIPSLQLTPSPRGFGYIVSSLRLRNCPVPVYVDGMPRGSNVDGLPSPKEIAGIEVYSRALTQSRSRFLRPVALRSAD